MHVVPPTGFRVSILAFILIVLASAGVRGQENDAGLWLSLSAEKKLSPRLSLVLSEEFRLNENISELGTFYSDLGLEGKLNKQWRLSMNYRFVGKRRLDDTYSKRHRYFVDLTYRQRLARFRLQGRARFQSQYTDVLSSQEGRVPENTSRYKLIIKYLNKSGLEPYVSSELFVPVSGVNAYLVEKCRYTAGIDYAFNRTHAVDVFYLIQQEYQVKAPRRDFIIGLAYYLSL